MSSLIKGLDSIKVATKWEKASILSLARKDSESNEVLDRFCPILPLLSKLIWSCLNPPPQKCSWRFQSHRCNFCTVLTVSGFKTKVIYSFSDKGFHLTEVCKIQVCVHLCMARCPWCWVQLFVVPFCGVMLSAWAVLQSLCELASAGCLCEQVPLQRAGSVWGVCVSHSPRAAVAAPGWPPKWHWLLWTGMFWSREALFIYSVLHLAVSHDWVLYAAPVTSGNEFFSFFYIWSVWNYLHAWCFNSVNSGIVC